MKKFFNKLKTDAKFANAGEGHKLTEDTRTYRPTTSQDNESIRQRPMAASQMQAGSAALERQKKSLSETKTVIPKVIRNRVDKETDHETASSKPGSTLSKGHPDGTISYHCPFTNAIIPKSNLRDCVREILLKKLGEDDVEASVLMMKMLNKKQDMVETAIMTLNKYINNVIDHPNDEKYRKIRKNNRVFREKVSLVEGSEEFLEACGFKRTLDGDQEIYFILNQVDEESLKSNLAKIMNIQKPPIKIYRDTKIFHLQSSTEQGEELSDSFFTLTTQEIKQEQLARANEIELSKQLRTRAMRKQDTVKPNYKYSRIRIKFPDGKILEGTFEADETVFNLMEFIRQHINIDWAVFALKSSTGAVVGNEEQALYEAELVPSAVLNLSWNEEIYNQILEEQGIALQLNNL